MSEYYPNTKFSGEKPKDNLLPDSKLIVIKSLTYNVFYSFLPYNFKMTEILNPDWNEQYVIGRTDPISTFKRMTRKINISFEARAVSEKNSSNYDVSIEELMHTVDHLKKSLYPRYDSSQVMVTPPLFRLKYGNIINAGEGSFNKGVFGYFNSFTANPSTDINKMFFYENKIYPKVYNFDFNFTILNENLVNSQQQEILKERYFYEYETDNHHLQSTLAANEAGAGGVSSNSNAEAGKQKVLNS